MSAITNIKQALLPQILTDRAMPQVTIAGTHRVLAWNANRLAGAVQA
jgi:hypothetical protein